MTKCPKPQKKIIKSSHKIQVSCTTKVQKSIHEIQGLCHKLYMVYDCRFVSTPHYPLTQTPVGWEVISHGVRWF